ncbi:TPA: lytic transglycosylase, partial [Neisseria gonorrhoeae]
MSKLKTIALTASGLSVCPGFLYAQNTSSHQVGLAIMRLNSSILDLPPTKQYFQSGSLWDELRQGFRMGEVNPELVRRHESKFIASRSYFDRVVNRSRPYMYHIANEVKKRNMPAEAALLPFIESAFVTKA